MNKEKLASEYAQSQIHQISDALEQAYLKGYEKAIIDNKKVFDIDGVEFVDLALPSGTLWSRHPLMKNGGYETIPYNEAINLPIPSKAQWEELVKHCDIINGREFCFVAPSPSSERIYFDYWRKGLIGDGIDYRKGYHFWLNGANISDKSAPVMICCTKNEENSSYPFKDSPDTLRNDKDFFISSDEYFSGFRLPVFLVKSKADFL